MFSRKALEKEARVAGEAAMIHRRNGLHMEPSPTGDRVAAILREAADREERASMRASERAEMPVVKRIFTK